jgi:hypothetical protein
MNKAGAAQEVGMRESEVSQAIRSYVNANYSQAKRLRYFKETENGQEYVEVEFMEDHREHSIKFSGDELVETEVEIVVAEVVDNNE